MRVRLTLILTIAAVCGTLVPATPVAAVPAARHGWFSATSAGLQHRVEPVARLRHAERARLSAVAKALTTPPPPVPVAPPAPPAAPARKAAPAPTLAAASNLDPASFIWPTRGPIGSPFGPRGGRRHDGVDIMAPTGALIVAPHAGTVTFTGWKNGYGNTVIIDHGDGLSTLYAHQSRIVARNGQHLDQGQLLGYVGSTGRVTAPHLHYEVHINGVPRNPMPWL